MDIDRLEEFIEIARCQSIKKAAARLQISPSTLRARFCSFEHTLGVPLFENSRTPLTLTREGALFYANAQEIVRRYADLKQELLLAGDTL